jgi:hypothetical protein
MTDRRTVTPAAGWGYTGVARALVCAATGCAHRAPPQITTVVFDGQSRSISGATTNSTEHRARSLNRLQS